MFDLGIRKMRLLTNRPTRRVVAVGGYDLEVVEQVLLQQPAAEGDDLPATTH